MYGCEAEPGRKLWLQIEPDAAAAQLVQFLLAEYQPTIRLVTCASGAQALAWLQPAASAAERERPDLIMTALHLPDYEAAELIQVLGSLPRGYGVPVVVWSPELSWPEAERHCRAAGARAILPRALDLEAFTSALLSLSEARPAELAQACGGRAG